MLIIQNVKLDYKHEHGLLLEAIFNGLAGLGGWRNISLQFRKSLSLDLLNMRCTTVPFYELNKVNALVF